ncbi:MAG: sporulation protein YunB [Clostridia bacterium]
MKLKKASPSFKKRRARFGIFIIFVIVSLTVVFCFFNNSVRPAMIALSESKVKLIVNRAMLNSIYTSMSNNKAYSNILSTVKIGERLSMLKTDSIAMNMLATECTEKAADFIGKLGEQGISIALGTLTNIPMFSGLGPKLKMTFTPAGSVLSEFDSQFSASGINQTLFRIMLKLTANVYIIMPGVSQNISVVTEVIIAESVIVGEVPQVFTDVANNEDMLNLIPTEIQ